MAKKKISAKEAVADIRAGIDDSALIGKYNLSPAGLQSLFDKLVNAGFIDLAEMESRLRGFLGTVIISESILPPKAGEAAESTSRPERKSPPRVNAQEAARDIRSGMNDASMMEKYRLSSKGLRTLFDKLISAGVISQDEIGRRYFGIDDTVDLREEMLSLSGALHYYGLGLPTSSTRDKEAHPLQSTAIHLVKDSAKKEQAAKIEKNHDSFQVTELAFQRHDNSWYRIPIIVSMPLLAILPLGLYVLYQNRTLSTMSQSFVTVALKLWDTACRALQAL